MVRNYYESRIRLTRQAISKSNLKNKYELETVCIILLILCHYNSPDLDIKFNNFMRSLPDELRYDHNYCLNGENYSKSRAELKIV